MSILTFESGLMAVWRSEKVSGGEGSSAAEGLFNRHDLLWEDTTGIRKSLRIFDILFSIYIHNWPLQQFSQEYGLASHYTYVVCVNFF